MKLIALRLRLPTNKNAAAAAHICKHWMDGGSNFSTSSRSEGSANFLVIQPLPPSLSLGLFLFLFLTQSVVRPYSPFPPPK